MSLEIWAWLTFGRRYLREEMSLLFYNTKKDQTACLSQGVGPMSSFYTLPTLEHSVQHR